MTETKFIPVECILPNPEQPRTEFDQDELSSLAESIKEHGLIQPITVEGPHTEGSVDMYILIDGERRWRATKLAGIDTIEAVIRNAKWGNQDQKLIHAMIANLQRSDLNPIEEAKAFRKMREHGLLIRSVAILVGRSIPYINFRLKLLDFEEEIQNYFALNKLPLDTACVYGIAKLPEDIRLSWVRRCVQRGLSVLGIRRSITRILNARAQEHDVDLTAGNKPPVITMSEKPGEDISAMFKVLGENDEIPKWEVITAAAKETCGHCLLSDVASTKICQDCPAVDLLKRITEIIQENG